MTENSAPYGPQPQSDFTSQLSRVFAAAGCTTQAELAGVLEISQPSVADARRRTTLPSDWLVTLFLKKRINPAWILTGLGGMLLPPAGEAGFKEQRHVTHCDTDELLAELARRVMKAMR